ncbi:MAG: competence protein TfoX [Bacillota bacterium]|nr:MAG: competence protein TfoX [Bacillota bacterium]
MATSNDFKIYIEDQLKHIHHIRFKKMFGEYGVFVLEKMVGILADDQLFIKCTDKGLKMTPDPVLASPYPGSKPYLLIENTEDIPYLEALISLTYEELPIPKPKKKKI